MAARAQKTGGRLHWKKIRVSYMTLRVLLVLLLLGAAAAGGSFWWSRHQGEESFLSRLLALAGRTVDKRLQLLTSGEGGDDLIERRYASLTFYTGSVKVQRAADLRWKDATEKMRLESGDRVRTFSNSRAEITFDDGNVLRIKPDSLIVIGDLTENVRTKVKKSSVRLLVSSVEADIKKSVVKGSRFRLEMPTAVADVEKARFSIDVGEDKRSRVRVFSGAMDIDTGKERVELTDRKSVMISALKTLSKTADLLPAPRMTRPKALEQFVTNREKIPLECRWEAVGKAMHYRLEVAADRFFDSIAFVRSEVPGREFTVPGLSAGVYYVRAAAVDRRKAVGAFSVPVPVRIIRDEVSPFVEIDKLVVLRTRRGREVMVNGRTEPAARVKIGGKSVPVDEAGVFSSVVRGVSPSQGEVEIVVRDAAGNEKTLKEPLGS